MAPPKTPFKQQSKAVPEDGYVTVQLGHLRAPLEAYILQQEPGFSLAQALRELIEIGLSSFAPEAGIHASRRRAFNTTRNYAYRRLGAALEEIRQDIENTQVDISALEENNNDDPSAL